MPSPHTASSFHSTVCWDEVANQDAGDRCNNSRLIDNETNESLSLLVTVGGRLPVCREHAELHPSTPIPLASSVLKAKIPEQVVCHMVCMFVPLGLI